MNPIQSLVYVLLMLLAGSRPGADALDSVPTDMYWAAHDLTPTVQMLEGALDANAALPATVDQDIRDLSSDDFKTRTKARQRLESDGPQVAEKLRPLMHAADPDLAQAATDLVTKFTASEHGAEIRRLMAIRTLGEKKEASALSLLKPLLASKEPFVALYAARSAAQIQGQPFVLPTHEKELAGDIQFVPKSAAIVGQAGMLQLEPISLAEVVEDAGGFAKDIRQRMGGRQGNVPAPGDADPVRRELLEFLDRVGDFRVDGVTIAIDGQLRWTEVIIHGAYNVEDVKGALGSDKEEKIHGVDTLSVAPDTAVLLPGADRFVVVVGETPQSAGVELAAAALEKPESAGLAGNAELAALVKKADVAAPGWAVCTVNDTLRAMPLFGGFDAVTLTSKRAADGGIGFTISGQGTDAAKAKASADDFNQGMAAAEASLNGEITRSPWESPGLTPLLETMKSMQATADGGHATAEGILGPKMTHMFMMGTGVVVFQQQETAARNGGGVAATQR